MRLSTGLTLDQVAGAARRRGLSWSESRVADFEAGRVAPNLETLIPYCLALTDISCSATPSSLVGPTNQFIALNKTLRLRASDIVKMLSGEAVAKPQRPARSRPMDQTERSALIVDTDERRIAEFYIDDVKLSTLRAIWESSGAAEERMRRSLGISLMLLANLSAALWKRRFSEERDRRAGENANAQMRGRISRQLREELLTAIERARDGVRK